jgi:RimJ/RimL family protein N-acetyltransferase
VRRSESGKGIELAIADTDDEFLGSAILHVNWRHERGGMGFWIARAARRRGDGVRAVTLLAGWAFDALGLGRVYLETYPSNVPMRRTAERAGLTEEGTLRGHALQHGERTSLVVYGLLASEWAGR